MVTLTFPCQDPIGSLPKFLNESNQCFRGWSQYSSLYLRKLALADLKICCEILLEYSTSKLTDACPDCLQVCPPLNRFCYQKYLTPLCIPNSIFLMECNRFHCAAVVKRTGFL